MSQDEVDSTDTLEITDEIEPDPLLVSVSPAKSIILLSLGPLTSQISSSLYGFIGTLWLANAVGDLATTSLSASMSIDYTVIAFGVFFGTCAISKIASLFGEKKTQEASRVISGLIQLSLLCGIIVPAIFLPIAKPLMRWFGSSNDVVEMGFDYLIIILCGTFFTCIYLLMCGCLQAEGRTNVYSSVQIASIILNALGLNPLFILVFKMGIRGVALSILLSQAIPGFVLVILYYRGTFSIKPHIRDLLKLPSRETYEALKVGSSSLISVLSGSLPALVFQKFIGLTASTEDLFNIHMSLYNAYVRILQIVIALYLAVSQALLTAASYSYSAKDLKRVASLILHSLWITSVIAVFFIVILFAAGRPISSIFSSRKEFQDLFVECAPAYWSCTIFYSWIFVATSILQALQRPVSAFWSTLITQLLLFPAMIVLVYQWSKTDPKGLYLSGVLNDVLSLIILIPFMIAPSKDILHGISGQDE